MGYMQLKILNSLTARHLTKSKDCDVVKTLSESRCGYDVEVDSSRLIDEELFGVKIGQAGLDWLKIWEDEALPFSLMKVFLDGAVNASSNCVFVPLSRT